MQKSASCVFFQLLIVVKYLHFCSAFIVLFLVIGSEDAGCSCGIQPVVTDLLDFLTVDQPPVHCRFLLLTYLETHL